MLTLEVKERGKEPAKILRNKGVVPAVFYGPKESTTAIAIDARRLEHVWKEAGETTIVTLQGIGEDKDTLIHDAQFHPVTGKLLHADFYVLERGKKLKIKVPIEFTGSAPAEKLGHIIVKALHEIEIEVEPRELPHHLTVELEALTDLGTHITAAQIQLPPSASLVTNPEEIVASTTAFVEEKEEITPPPETEILTAKPEEGATPAEGAAAPAETKQEKGKAEK
jgi:large subunit ribosomal protein L25